MCIRDRATVALYGLSPLEPLRLAVRSVLSADTLILVSNIYPVSYTHLDVYKRQAYACVCALLRAPEPAAAPALHGRHLPLEAGQMCIRDRLRAVLSLCGTACAGIGT